MRTAQWPKAPAPFRRGFSGRPPAKAPVPAPRLIAAAAATALAGGAPAEEERHSPKLPVTIYGTLNVNLQATQALGATNGAED